ncbi:MAG: hypothetical protein J0L65_05715 [Xanthomonadales bacterium]|jgi:hypothetical protein|nr:hypothetical protein [Xanthomonadales bacterium]
MDMVPTFQGTFENFIANAILALIFSVFAVVRGKIKAKSSAWLNELKIDAGLKFRTFARSVVWLFLSLTLNLMSMALLVISRIDATRAVFEGANSNSGADFNYWFSFSTSVVAFACMAFGLYLLASLSMATITVVEQRETE